MKGEGALQKFSCLFIENKNDNITINPVLCKNFVTKQDQTIKWMNNQLILFNVICFMNVCVDIYKNNQNISLYTLSSLILY